jgi:hypothetical protein
MARVIMKKSFHSYYQMENFSCHHRSQEVHSIVALKDNHRFVSQTPPSSKDKPLGLDDPNKSMWDT